MILRLFAASLLLTTGAVVAPASESTQSGAEKRKDTGSEATPSPVVAPIERAKSQFEAVKGLKQSQAVGTGSSGLRLDAGIPTLDPGTPAPGYPRSSTAQTPSGRPKPGLSQPLGTGHGESWLVDSMLGQAKKSGHDGREAGAEGKNLRGENIRDSDSVLPRRGGSVLRERTSEAGGLSAVEKIPATNPFAPYLSSWMTPQDYALLIGKARDVGKGEHGAGAASVPGSSSVRNSGDGGLRLAITAGRQRLGGGRDQTLGGAGGGGAANPYLKQLELPAGFAGSAGNQPQVSGFGLSVRKSDANSSVLPGLTHQAQSPAPAKGGQIPEALKLESDKKYFRQLKRF